MLRLNNITFAYPNQTPIFQNYCWKVNNGQTWAVLGPSGCGKSTLLYLLAGLQRPDLGEVLLQGDILYRPHPRTGLIIQDYGLLPWATVEQNIKLGIQIRGFYGPDGTHAPEDINLPDTVDYWIERLKLIPHVKKYPSQLSGGQRQRTAIARTLVLKPNLILMDEPFSSLDVPTRESLQNLILELQSEQDLTMVIVTHAIEEASIMGKQILLLDLPPNKHPRIMQNPEAGNENFRESDSYQEVCRQLRAALEN